MNETTSRLRLLTSRLIELRDQIEDLEEQTQHAKRSLRQITEEDLPGICMELGLTELTLEDGTKVTIKEDVQASITEAHREAAHQWLVANGFGGLIKTEVKLEFEAGDREEAVNAADQLAATHDHVTLQEKVNPQTLKAFVRERLTAGDEVPMDLFSVFPRTVAQLRKPRK